MRLRIPLSLLLLLPPFLRISDTKSMLENSPNLLKCHVRGLRETEVYKQPAEEAKSCVEAECSRGSDAFHHGQEG